MRYFKLSLLGAGVLSFLVLQAGKSGAEIYTYQDGKGTVIYADDLGKIPAKYRSKARSMAEPDLVTITDAVPDKGKGGSGRTSARKGIKEKERFSGTIEMYVTAWCPVCVDAEAYIKDKNYPYVKYDVEKDSSAKARAAGYPGRGVPLIVVGERNFRGFSPKTLEYYMEK